MSAFLIISTLVIWKLFTTTGLWLESVAGCGSIFLYTEFAIAGIFYGGTPLRLFAPAEIPLLEVHA